MFKDSRKKINKLNLKLFLIISSLLLSISIEKYAMAMKDSEDNNGSLFFEKAVKKVKNFIKTSSKEGETSSQLFSKQKGDKKFKKLIRKNSGLEDYEGIFQKISSNPKHTCKFANYFVNGAQDEYIKENKEEKYILVLSKLFKNYSYCFTESIDNVLSLYKSALFRNQSSTQIIYENMPKVIKKHFIDECKAPKETLFQAIEISDQQSIQTSLYMIDGIFSEFRYCFTESDIQEVFEFVMPSKIKLSNSGLSNEPIYVNFEAAKIIFSRFKEFLSDEQLSLLYESSLLFVDTEFLKDLDYYIGQVLVGDHQFNFSSLAADGTLKKHIWSTL